ncbi:hypothetical protein BO99DRAFT_51226 [Aspergillus violaceofuscus CBS 115571]|uniref:Uncharacterized protein n=1 Tax=Aspergillus violaceofuscus (strain CBS 115571) TaxID=1450538 RepID=A0A2V5HBS3_ASPV1|nr:hypothetical protein BO99DRAFT_51226 [Aspergillus violaceofuscus CBS 115571]
MSPDDWLPLPGGQLTRRLVSRTAGMKCWGMALAVAFSAMLWEMGCSVPFCHRNSSTSSALQSMVIEVLNGNFPSCLSLVLTTTGIDCACKLGVFRPTDPQYSASILHQKITPA